MSESILISTKKILGIDESYTAFDLDIITHINSALMIVNQLGIGPEPAVNIEDDTTTWDYVTQANTMLASVKSYVYLRVRLLFDPPQTSFLIKAQEEQLRELEWRLSVYRESTHWVDPDVEEPILIIDGGHP